MKTFCDVKALFTEMLVKPKKFYNIVPTDKCWLLLAVANLNCSFQVIYLVSSLQIKHCLAARPVISGTSHHSSSH